MKMKFLLCSAGLFFMAGLQPIAAQYCSPSMTTGGLYISYLNFTYSNITGGVIHNSGSEGYADRSASSSGTIGRNCGFGIYYNIQNCGNQGAKNFNIRMYIDWNHDNDFDDANEMVAEKSTSVPNGSCAMQGTSLFGKVPPNAITGATRVRVILREGGATATSCGGYIGEAEDYTLTVSPNTAPVMNNAGTPFLNPLTETQTDNRGATIAQLVGSTRPDQVMITDADNCSNTDGIAVTAVAAPNGEWQYKIGAGSWTSFGAVSTSNALLLYFSNSAKTRIRFVPSGPGTSNITFRAWDQSQGENGSYYNISSSGGSTAFSVDEETASLVTYSTAATANDIGFYATTASSPTDDYNIEAGKLNRSTGVLKQTEAITSGSYEGYGFDIAMDIVNNNLFWAGGPSGVGLMRCNLDGSNVEVLVDNVFGYPTGIAVSDSKIFVIDYGAGIYSADLDGGNFTAITGGAGQATDINETYDLEYYNNKIYYVNKPTGPSNYSIYAANTDGTGTTTLYSTTNVVLGLYLDNNTVYWTEYDGAVGYVKSMPVSIGSVTTLASQSGYYNTDLHVDASQSRIYLPVISASNTDPGIQSIPLSGGSFTWVAFLDNQVNSLVMNTPSSTLPVKFESIKAYRQSNDVQVEWKVGTELNVDHYMVERSADGVQFVPAGAVTASGKSVYQWLDKHPNIGFNYYRVVAVDLDNSKRYSQVVKINLLNENQAVAVYPTVVRNGRVNLQLTQMPPGRYELKVFDMAGRQVGNNTIQHAGGSSSQTVSLPASLSNGWYKVSVSGAARHYVTTIHISQ